MRECVLGRLNFSIFAIKCVDWLESMDFKEEISIKKGKLLKISHFSITFTKKRLKRRVSAQIHFKDTKNSLRTLKILLLISRWLCKTVIELVVETILFLKFKNHEIKEVFHWKSEYLKCFLEDNAGEKVPNATILGIRLIQMNHSRLLQTFLRIS